MVAETRPCEQCGTSFVPRREHARFCSPSCRAAWNHEHTGDLKAGTSALLWSITAMSDATRRLSRVTAWNQARAFAVISEAVWWVTIVDATLVRHHLEAYDAVIAGQAPAERELVEGTLAGLRFVRNRIGDEADLADFIEPSEPAARLRQRAYHRLDLEAGTRTGTGVDSTTRAALGDGPVPGVPSSASRPRHRGDLHPGRSIPQSRHRHAHTHRHQHRAHPTLTANSTCRRRGLSPSFPQ